ncbi:hypothetical protein [Nostoc sp.]
MTNIQMWAVLQHLAVVYFKLQLGQTPVEKGCVSNSHKFYIEVNQLIH